ncbi:MAG: exosortase/archaeosortase family protein [Planctomycetes bacterium]|nr:exosortase/archaeosortase family protein [Planctomycetota bacterium]
MSVATLKTDRLWLAAASFGRCPRKLATFVLGVGLLWVYWPTLLDVAGRWRTDSQYSHGYAVPLFSLYLLWRRRDLLAALQPTGWGLLILAGGLALRFFGTYIYLDWLQGLALLPCLAGACLLAGGWRALHWSWPAIAFLIFMLPLPHRIETGLAYPLQRVATLASTYILQTLGVAAFSEGNVICMGPVRIGVVEACSGLSMLMIFFALSTAVCLVVDRPWGEKALIFASSIPIALAANIIRIVVTAVLHKTVSSAWADYVFHDLFGWLMMPLALAMLWAEMRLFAWLVVDLPVRDPEIVRIPGTLTRTALPRMAAKETMMARASSATMTGGKATG